MQLSAVLLWLAAAIANTIANANANAANMYSI